MAVKDRQENNGTNPDPAGETEENWFRKLAKTPLAILKGPSTWIASTTGKAVEWLRLVFTSKITWFIVVIFAVYAFVNFDRAIQRLKAVSMTTPPLTFLTLRRKASSLGYAAAFHP
ncbi:MAG: hypothetical protein ACU0BK_09330 [Shimia sp.]|uniref:hypothetical protein n=1 Tax=Shimia sp. TaxID=1954381 RepID=UPI004059794E